MENSLHKIQCPYRFLHTPIGITNEYVDWEIVVNQKDSKQNWIECLDCLWVTEKNFTPDMIIYQQIYEKWNMCHHSKLEVENIQFCLTCRISFRFFSDSDLNLRDQKEKEKENENQYEEKLIEILALQYQIPYSLLTKINQISLDKWKQEIKYFLMDHPLIKEKICHEYLTRKK